MRTSLLVAASRELASRCDYAIFSEPGLAAASGTANAREGLRRMQTMVRGVVGVTLGAERFLWLDAGTERHAPAPPVVVVDTLAAGDVFHAAFTLAIAEGATMASAAAFANAGALKCTRPGGRNGAPMRANVAALLRERP
jgi:sulfofructose kinase